MENASFSSLNNESWADEMDKVYPEDIMLSEKQEQFRISQLEAEIEKSRKENEMLKKIEKTIIEETKSASRLAKLSQKRADLEKQAKELREMNQKLSDTLIVKDKIVSEIQEKASFLNVARVGKAKQNNLEKPSSAKNMGFIPVNFKKKKTPSCEVEPWTKEDLVRACRRYSKPFELNQGEIETLLDQQVNFRGNHGSKALDPGRVLIDHSKGIVYKCDPCEKGNCMNCNTRCNPCMNLCGPCLSGVGKRRLGFRVNTVFLCEKIATFIKEPECYFSRTCCFPEKATIETN